ncbi:hypothetical protein PACILC2_22240 [Paenibacillus cisolokensis]|uniref:Uncharacterized protein n=1 Tax=Paenibacillus cisolokensis TaxID=1658519 RepID=A0ABQ4N689_9BACL|nr:hypothetical protein [Paenibacillus cisolokensis]GIQ63656.1 hypothetical protein PACILC2_22240 [Paenibacillus cisolokensis]
MTDRFYSELQSLAHRVRNESKRLSSELSRVDRIISGIYHEIEGCRFDVVSGYRLAKRLQDVLKERREIKREIAKLSPVRRVLSDDNLKLTQSQYAKACEK